MEEKKLQNIALLDVHKLIPLTDYFILGTASNKKQAQALCDELKKQKKELGLKLYGFEGGEESQWILLDYGEIVVHIFQDPWRDYYDLEILWGDAPRVQWQADVEQTI